MNWTTADLERLKQRGMVAEKHTFSPEKYSQKICKNIHDPKKPKYGNKITFVDDHRFDSAKEASRYQVLRHWRDMGAISNLELQKEYELNEHGTHSLIYKADFVYYDNIIKQQVVEDVKGFRTREYKKKRRLMLKVYKIKILET